MSNRVCRETRRECVKIKIKIKAPNVAQSAEHRSQTMSYEWVAVDPHLRRRQQQHEKHIKLHIPLKHLHSELKNPDFVDVALGAMLMSFKSEFCSGLLCAADDATDAFFSASLL